MATRMTNPAYLLPDAMKGIGSLLKAIKDSGLDPRLRELVGLRTSQINGCAACTYAHLHEAREAGETEERIGNVAAWRHAPFYSDAERAALALAERMTRLADRSDEAVSDELWEEVNRHFGEKEVSGLLLTVALLNLFTRINVTLREPAGTTWN